MPFLQISFPNSRIVFCTSILPIYYLFSIRRNSDLENFLAAYRQQNNTVFRINFKQVAMNRIDAGWVRYVRGPLYLHSAVSTGRLCHVTEGISKAISDEILNIKPNKICNPQRKNATAIPWQAVIICHHRHKSQEVQGF